MTMQHITHPPKRLSRLIHRMTVSDVQTIQANNGMTRQQKRKNRSLRRLHKKQVDEQKHENARDARHCLDKENARFQFNCNDNHKHGHSRKYADGRLQPQRQRPSIVTTDYTEYHHELSKLDKLDKLDKPDF